jgi:rubredoxin---NAD+ reductase
MTAPIIILGSGLAGYTLAREFRKLDAKTPLTIVTRDNGCVYSKPMLSNALSSGKAAADLPSASADKAALDLQATILAGTEVTALDTATKMLQTSRGELRYRALVFAVGAEPIRPALTGDAQDAVFSVNDLSGYARFRAALKPGAHVAILGSGLIGCEFANDLASAGFAVTVIGPSAYPLQPLAPQVVGETLQSALASVGVNWRLGRTATMVSRQAGRIALTLDDASSIVADVVLSAIGLRPCTVLAQAAGIVVNRGIATDSQLHTSAADVYALGDCAEIDGCVMPYVMPIMHAARALAKTLAGQATSVVFPLMPVAVKTPACPIVIQPAPMGSETQWVTMESDNGLQLWQLDRDGKMLGFALTGAKTRQRAAMLARLEQS